MQKGAWKSFGKSFSPASETIPLALRGQNSKRLLIIVIKLLLDPVYEALQQRIVLSQHKGFSASASITK
jgi:hypothetical protein